MNRETEGLPKSVIDGLANLGAEQATAAPAEPFTEEVAPQEPASAEPAAPAEEPTAAPEKKVYNNYDDYVALMGMTRPFIKALRHLSFSKKY